MGWLRATAVTVPTFSRAQQSRPQTRAAEAAPLSRAPRKSARSPRPVGVTVRVCLHVSTTPRRPPHTGRPLRWGAGLCGSLLHCCFTLGALCRATRGAHPEEAEPRGSSQLKPLTEAAALLTCILGRDRTAQGETGTQEPHLESQVLHEVACPVVLLVLVPAANIDPHPDLDRKQHTNHSRPPLTPTPPGPPPHPHRLKRRGTAVPKQGPRRGTAVPKQDHRVQRRTGHPQLTTSRSASPLLPAVPPDWSSRTPTGVSNWVHPPGTVAP